MDILKSNEEFNKDKFEKKIRDELNGFNLKQITYFAWICGVRSVPFLGEKKDFSYWKKYKIDKHLYGVFSSLDYPLYFSNNLQVGKVINAAGTAARAADYARAAAYATAHAAAYATAAARAAAYATAHAHARARASVYATDAAVYVAEAAVYAGATMNSFGHNLGEEFSSIILLDIEKIKNNDYKSFTFEKSTYGNCFNNFFDSLRNLGYKTYADLYEDIFKNGFALNESKLKERIKRYSEVKENIGLKAMSDYLEELAKGSEDVYISKIIVLGDKGAGKTSISKRLVDSTANMPNKEDSTKGIDITKWDINHKDIKATAYIWDFAGHVITHAVHKCFLTNNTIYIIVYDGRYDREDRLYYWLDHVKNYGNKSKVIILVNEIDEHTLDIPKNTLKSKYGFIEGFYGFSILKDTDELEKLKEQVKDFVLVKHTEASSYVQVKNELDKLFEKNNEDLINLDKFYKLSKEHKVDVADSMLKYFNERGICLWYKNLKNLGTIILNPEWIITGIYTIINKYKQISSDNNIIDGNMFSKIFKNNTRYPIEKREFLFRVLVENDLAYSNDDCKTITIPLLYPKDRPEYLPTFEENKYISVMFKSEYTLPPDIMTRFIVQRHFEIQENTAWRHGCVFQKKQATALVIENDRNIIIKVKGAKKEEYKNELEEDMEKIFNTYNSNDYEVSYNVFVGNNNITIEKKILDSMKEHKIDSYFAYRSGELIPTSKLNELIGGKTVINIDIKNCENFNVAGINNGQQTVINNYDSKETQKKLESLEENDLDEIIVIIKKILESKEFKDEVTFTKVEELNKITIDTKQDTKQDKSKFITDFLSIAADVVTIVTPIITLISNKI